MTIRDRLSPPPMTGIGTKIKASQWYGNLMGSLVQSRTRQQMLEMGVGTLEDGDIPNDVVQNACSLAAMDTFLDPGVHSNLLVRDGCKMHVGPRDQLVNWRGEEGDEGVEEGANTSTTNHPKAISLRQVRALVAGGRVSNKGINNVDGGVCAIDRTPRAPFVTNVSCGNRIKRNKLGPPPQNAAVAAAAPTTTVAKDPMHVRVRRLATKVATNPATSPTTKSHAESVRVALSNENNDRLGLKTLIDDSEPVFTQEGLETCVNVVKHWKSNE